MEQHEDNVSSESLLEKDLQKYIVKNLNSFFNNSSIELIGTEFATQAGRIDILARNDNNNITVIELKIGTASRDAVGQLLSYIGAIKKMEDFEDDYVRGILIAENIDDKAQFAISELEDIHAYEYRTHFKLKSIEDSIEPEEHTEEKWILDFNNDTFCRHRPRTQDWDLNDYKLVISLIGSKDIEIHKGEYVLGPYRKL